MNEQHPDPGTRFARVALPLLDTLYTAALRLTRHPADAEDLVQDTYLAAFRAFGRLDENANVRAWLFRIMANANIDAYRRRRARPHTVPADDQVVEAAIPAPRGLRSAESEVLDQLAGGEVGDALRELPEEFRVTVYLADVEGYSYREIAGLTGVSLGTVNTRVHRARRRLRELLSDVAGERVRVAA